MAPAQFNEALVNRVGDEVMIVIARYKRPEKKASSSIPVLMPPNSKYRNQSSPCESL